MLERESPPADGPPDAAGSSQAFAALTLALSPAMLYVADTGDTGSMRFVSASAMDVTGFMPERYVADPDLLRARIPADDREEFERRIEGLEREQCVSINHRFRTADGRLRWFRHDLRLNEVPGSKQRQVVGCMLEVFDESSAKGAGTASSGGRVTKRALQQSEEHFRNIVEGHPLPVWMVDVETAEILYESPAAAAMMGREWSSDAPRRTTDFYADPAARGPLIEELLARGEVRDVEVEMKRADGTRFWAAMSSRLITYAGRTACVSSLTDLTQRLAMEEEMVRQREVLSQNEKLSAMGELLASVAHELNNPLSVVVGLAELMQEEATSHERTSETAMRLGRAANRCARIVKTFLAMARQEPAKRGAVDLNELIRGAMEVTEYSMRASDIEASVELSSPSPKVWGDGSQLSQVLTNLIVNAQHALEEHDAPRRFTLRSRIHEPGNRVIVEVRDNGPGIAPDISNRIFEPFFTTKRDGGGTGLGLALCHRIVRAHGGQLTVESTPGHGACFFVDLPLAPARSDTAADPSSVPVKTRQLSVLVVDDEPEVAELLADILTADGHRVAIAGSGTEALDKIGQTEFDIVLSDLRMPNLDGPGLYRALQERKAGLAERLAFITGDTMSPKASLFIRSVNRPYLEKPITPQAVRELVRSIVTPRR